MRLLPYYKLCLVFFALILPVQVCAGGIYVYEDEEGVRHYTNTPTSSRYKPATFSRLNTPRNNSSQHIGNRRTSSGYHDSAQYDRQIKRAAGIHMVDPLLIKAIIKAESAFDQFATSSKGAQGLMQLMPETARDLRVGNPYNATQNINGGTRYFKKLLDSYEGDLSRSLAAYNAGPGRVAKKGPLPMIKETRTYVQRVIQYYQLYQQATSSPGTSQTITLQKLVTVN